MGGTSSRLSDDMVAKAFPAADAFAGRVALVTGPTAGIGYHTARVLAKHGFHVVLAARDVKKMAEVKERLIAEIKAERGASFTPLFSELPMDVSSLESVRTAAHTFLSRGQPLHLLILNAGIMAVPYRQTVDGFESQSATNHLGHYYLTRFLLPKLRATATADVPARILTLSSVYHEKGHFPTADDIAATFTMDRAVYSPFPVYGRTKLMNIWHARWLAEQEASNNILAFSVHPGVVCTDLARDHTAAKIYYAFGKLWMKNPNQGASTTIHAALFAPREQSGRYFVDNAVAETSAEGRNDEYKQRLIEVSERLVNEWEAKHPAGAAAASASAAAPAATASAAASS